MAIAAHFSSDLKVRLEVGDDEQGRSYLVKRVKNTQTMLREHSPQWLGFGDWDVPYMFHHIVAITCLFFRRFWQEI